MRSTLGNGYGLRFTTLFRFLKSDTMRNWGFSTVDEVFTTTREGETH
jgi:hypothetical protein